MCDLIYLDDILIYSKDLEEHHNQVRNVLQTLINNNLYVKLEKCEFDQNKVEFLGYIFLVMVYLLTQRKLNQ